jgi:hypothetical protein
LTQLRVNIKVLNTLEINKKISRLLKGIYQGGGVGNVFGSEELLERRVCKIYEGLLILYQEEHRLHFPGIFRYFHFEVVERVSGNIHGVCFKPCTAGLHHSEKFEVALSIKWNIIIRL